MKTLMRLFWTAVLCGCVASAFASQAGSRAVGVTPLSKAIPEEYGDFYKQTYGVFVGVDKFEDDAIVDLRFCAADARVVRDCFVHELQYMPPENARLLVSNPKGENELAPTRANIMSEIRRAAQAAGPKGCVVVHLSTHGIEGYVLAEDSRRFVLEDTAIPLRRIEDFLASSASPRRLLIFDACREVVFEGERGLKEAMNAAFANAFANAKGMAVLMSCSEGQVSYEMPQLGRGVFTHFLLEGLRGRAPVDRDGVITVTALAKWVQQEVEDWSRTQPRMQSPRFDLRQATGDLPLSLSPDFAERRQRSSLIIAAENLTELLTSGKITALQLARAQAALAGEDPKRKEAALAIAHGRVPPDLFEQVLPPEIIAAPEPPPPLPALSPEPAAKSEPAETRAAEPAVIAPVVIVQPPAPREATSMLDGPRRRYPEVNTLEDLDQYISRNEYTEAFRAFRQRHREVREEMLPGNPDRERIYWLWQAALILAKSNASDLSVESEFKEWNPEARKKIQGMTSLAEIEAALAILRPYERNLKARRLIQYLVRLLEKQAEGKK